MEHILELERRRSCHEPLSDSLAVPQEQEKTKVRTGHRENEIHDPVVCRDIRVDRTAFRPARSLAPDESIMLGCVHGDEECCAIRDAWRPSLEIVSRSSAHFDRGTEENPMLYVPSMVDLAEDK